MNETAISDIQALEILDSRGNPTVCVTVCLGGGVTASSSVPSGASTGRREAVELRDGDSRRYQGKGVQKAVRNVNEVLATALKGIDVTRQAEIDGLMVDLDGTPDRSRLGANALLGVSQACARAAARARRQPLYEYLAATSEVRLPMPLINIINGGRHADSSLDIQEFMIVPISAPTFAEAMRYSVAVFNELKSILHGRGYTIAVGDEGGFAPLLHSEEEACETILEAVLAAGLQPGKDIALALDVAASSFFKKGLYEMSRTGYRRPKSSAEMTGLYQQWVRKYPIVSIEDGLSEDDWDGFRILTDTLGESVQIVGDDLLVTNTRFIERAIAERSCNAALVKPNQIGTVTETIAAVDLCRNAGWNFVIAHRSGETEDTFLADFAVAMGGGQIKAGSVCRGERVAKYNRLLRIEQELGRSAQLAPWPAR